MWRPWIAAHDGPSGPWLLAQRPGESRSRMNGPSQSKIVLFEVARQRFAALLSDVVEVLRAVTITRLPKAPAVIEGIINLRGAVIPVLDIRARFGLPERAVEPTDQLVIVRAGGRVAALHVDRTIDLVRLDRNTIQDAKDILPDPAHIAGVAKLRDGLVLIYDLQAFLTEAETDEFDRALAEITDA